MLHFDMHCNQYKKVMTNYHPEWWRMVKASLNLLEGRLILAYFCLKCAILVKRKFGQSLPLWCAVIYSRAWLWGHLL